MNNLINLVPYFLPIEYNSGLDESENVKTTSFIGFIDILVNIGIILENIDSL